MHIEYSEINRLFAKRDEKTFPIFISVKGCAIKLTQNTGQKQILKPS